jgi:hypothetical protein
LSSPAPSPRQSLRGLAPAVLHVASRVLSRLLAQHPFDDVQAPSIPAETPRRSPPCRCPQTAGPRGPSSSGQLSSAHRSTPVCRRFLAVEYPRLRQRNAPVQTDITTSASGKPSESTHSPGRHGADAVFPGQHEDVGFGQLAGYTGA